MFDRAVTLDDVPDGCRAMADREARKVLVRKFAKEVMPVTTWTGDELSAIDAARELETSPRRRGGTLRAR